MRDLHLFGRLGSKSSEAKLAREETAARLLSRAKQH
jgi:hypothetical protein